MRGFKLRFLQVLVLILPLHAVPNVAQGDSNEPNRVKWSQPPVAWQEPNTYIGWDEPSYLDEAYYARWLAAGRPDCWTTSCPRQCYGDADCMPYGKTGYWVSVVDLQILRDCYDPIGGPFIGCECADFDRDGDVDGDDETILETWFNQPDVPSDCPEVFGPVMVADDFLCNSSEPITALRWWGSFEDWQDDTVPQANLPTGFHLTIWTDVPAGVDADYSHPGQVIWENYCDTYDVNFFGWEHDPRSQEANLAKFEFYQELSPRDYWYQPNDVNTYWLGIMAIYDQKPNSVWGWETRPHYYNDDAIRLFARPEPDTNYPPEVFEPVEFDSNSWDLSFELISNPKMPTDPNMDLGDAPDSTNNFGVPMTAYPGKQAEYPTVYMTGSPPYGPIHWEPNAVAYLGNGCSLEVEADIGPDSDGLNNIVPNNNIADKDGFDDGVLNMPLYIPSCGRTTFDYLVTVTTPNVSLYVNVWFDWNHDGDWNDSKNCPVYWGDPVPNAPEWAVQNQLLSGLSAGVHQITTPPVVCNWAYFDGGEPYSPVPIWMRITLSEQPWIGSGSGGSGPANGYQYGETEDYYFTPHCLTQPDHNEWVAVGEPECWCYPRQCRGDATRYCIGKCPYCVSVDDLVVLKAGWAKSFPDIQGKTVRDIDPDCDYGCDVSLICADFDHKPHGKNAYRVSVPDLQILKANWNFCSGGPPADCFMDY
jgi:hypothetical protein